MEKAPFTPPAASESRPSAETSQAAYVRTLQEHYDSIPDLTGYTERDFSLPYEVAALSSYSNNWVDPSESIRRPDIIDPDFCHSSIGLSQNAAKWHDARASREWDIFYVGHMKQRRGFHVQFMQALLDKSNVSFDQIGKQANGQDVTIPSGPRLPVYPHTAEFPYDLHDKTNWLVASVLSALALPPEHCDAAMKHHAVKLLAEHADFSNEHSFNFLEIEDESMLRLPWSMRVGSEFHQESNLEWINNAEVRHFIGRDGGIDLKARYRLFNEQPHDYVQLRIMQLFDRADPDKKALLQDLANLTKLEPEVQDILFSEKASFVTVHGDINFDRQAQRRSLSQLLEPRS